MYLSQKRLEIEGNKQNLGIRFLVMFTVKHFSTFRKFKKFKKIKKIKYLRIQSLITTGMRCLHRHKNRMINAKYTWRSLVLVSIWCIVDIANIIRLSLYYVHMELQTFSNLYMCEFVYIMLNFIDGRLIINQSFFFSTNTKQELELHMESFKKELAERNEKYKCLVCMVS